MRACYTSLSALYIFEEFWNECLFSFLKQKYRHSFNLHPSIPLLPFRSAWHHQSSSLLHHCLHSSNQHHSSLYPLLQPPAHPQAQSSTIFSQSWISNLATSVPTYCPEAVHHCIPVSVILLAKDPQDPSIHLPHHLASSTVDCGNVGLAKAYGIPMTRALC